MPDDFTSALNYAIAQGWLSVENGQLKLTDSGIVDLEVGLRTNPDWAKAKIEDRR